MSINSPEVKLPDINLPDKCGLLVMPIIINNGGKSVCKGNDIDNSTIIERAKSETKKRTRTKPPNAKELERLGLTYDEWKRNHDDKMTKDKNDRRRQRRHEDPEYRAYLNEQSRISQAKKRHLKRGGTEENFVIQPKRERKTYPMAPRKEKIGKKNEEKMKTNVDSDSDSDSSVTKKRKVDYSTSRKGAEIDDDFDEIDAALEKCKEVPKRKLDINDKYYSQRKKFIEIYGDDCQEFEDIMVQIME